MNHLPLFRIKLWNNIMCYMSFYILTLTSWHRHTFPITLPLWRESPNHRWIPNEMDSNLSFGISFGVKQQKHMNKQSCRRWYETRWCSYILLLVGVLGWSLNNRIMFVLIIPREHQSDDRRNPWCKKFSTSSIFVNINKNILISMLGLQCKESKPYKNKTNTN